MADVFYLHNFHQFVKNANSLLDCNNFSRTNQTNGLNYGALNYHQKTVMVEQVLSEIYHILIHKNE